METLEEESLDLQLDAIAIRGKSVEMMGGANTTKQFRTKRRGG